MFVLARVEFNELEMIAVVDKFNELVTLFVVVYSDVGLLVVIGAFFE